MGAVRVPTVGGSKVRRLNTCKDLINVLKLLCVNKYLLIFIIIIIITASSQ